MSIFSCKTCEAHKAHIKSLEDALKFMKDQQGPASFVYAETEEYTTPPAIQPVFIPNQELNEQREFSADELLTGQYE